MTLRYFSSILIYFSILSTIAQVPVVNQDRLEQSIFDLAVFGKKENGETSRVAFSKADIDARAFVIDLMKQAGLKVSVDYAGNIIGRKSGTDSAAKPIAFGSHIDTVPDGGNYDGCVGSMGAIEVVKTLQEHNIQTTHPLELIIFSNEEGGVMGSRALAGELPPEALPIANSTGYTMGEGIRRLGGDPDKIPEVKRKRGSLAAFLELHIEQGGILDKENIDIGVVEGIVGLKWWDVTIEGFANHAGTTPMNSRQDALLAAARFIIAVNEVTNSFEGRQVGTVGRIKATPGAPNVIPGKVVLSLEIRDLDGKKIEQVYNAIEKEGKAIAKASGTIISFTPLSTTAKPALTAKAIQEKITQVVDQLQLSRKQMPSGAGHDAQDMALIAPTGMIFVPSRDGISHSPREFTSARDMANGANVLLQTILLLDKE